MTAEPNTNVLCPKCHRWALTQGKRCLYWGAPVTTTHQNPMPGPISGQAKWGQAVPQLTTCPACGRVISSEAEACPQCGRPNRRATPSSMGPKCYACSSLATTRCQSCGALSCARHLQSIYVRHGRGGAYELRSESCYSFAGAWRVVSLIIVAIALIGGLIMWSQMGRR